MAPNAYGETMDLTWVAGGRLDKHNLMDGVIFSPRANLRFNPTEKINLRASYSYGFRAPQATSTVLPPHAVFTLA